MVRVLHFQNRVMWQIFVVCPICRTGESRTRIMGALYEQNDPKMEGLKSAAARGDLKAKTLDSHDQ